MSVILCPHCGTTNRVGSNFCNACGTDLRTDLRGDEEASREADSQSSAAQESAPQEPARRTRRRRESRGDATFSSSASEPVDSSGSTEAEPSPTPFFPQQPWLRDEESAATEADAGDSSGARAATPRESESLDNAWEADDAYPDAARGGFDPMTGEYFGDEWEEAGELDDFPEEVAGDPTRAPRLVTGIQGLLDPIRVSRRLQESPAGEEPAARVQARPGAETSDPVRLEKLRRFRNLLYEDPRLPGNRRRAAAVPTRPALVVPWVFLLVAVMVGVPVFFGWGDAENQPPEWTGVAEAYAVIDSLPPDAVVLVYWAYDPATAGELDLAARPVIRHLLEKRARLVGVSSLPAGPATARRVVDQVRQTRDAGGFFSEASRNPWPVQVAFLPGGVSTLPLVATDPATALGLDPNEAGTQDLLVRPPVLSVVLGAQTDDVQQWLEQVQTRLGIPVVAVVGAGADPLLRPFMDSGQLRGLVSGFDGAYHYNRRVGLPPASAEARGLAQQVNAQNWAHGAILLLLVLGNLAALVGRGGRG